MTTWENDLTLGVRFMDHEHAGLHASLTELGELAATELPVNTRALARDARANAIRLRLDRLRLEVSTHFTHEEQVMRAHHYPRAGDHIAKHTKFLDELDAMSSTYAVGEAAMALRVVQFVQIWFARHTVASDQALGEWLNEHHPDVTT